MENVRFAYGKKEYTVKNTSVSLRYGEFTAIIGDNGSGKTTLGKIMTGIIKPSYGKAFIFGKDSLEMTLGEIGSQIGYLFQNPDKQLFTSSVETEIAFPLEIKGFPKERVENIVSDMLKLFQLDHVRKTFPFYLSQGEKQRLALAAILANSSGYLILDEPTTGLDLKRKKILSEVLEKLIDQGIGMTVISHDKEFIARHAARTLIISGGEIIGDMRKENRPQV